MADLPITISLHRFGASQGRLDVMLDWTVIAHTLLSMLANRGQGDTYKRNI
jgi:cephalosporin-C deacetylase-like acetyl esterase